MTSQEILPTFEPTSQIDLVSVESSKITNVSVYPTRAEVTRLFKFTVKTGQNQVNINGLPVSLERESLRIEGRGAATIHDVTISELPKSSSDEANRKLNELREEKTALEEKLNRCRKGQGALETYLGSLNSQHTEAGRLETILDSYDRAGDKLHTRTVKLQKLMKQLDVAIAAEAKNVAVTSSNDKLRLKVSVGVFAANEGDVEIILIYAVNGATWKAFYDIRVDMNTKEKPVTLIYKAAIKQDTGESWDDVVLSLETVAPTIGVEIPKLQVWRLARDWSRSGGARKAKGLAFGGGGGGSESMHLSLSVPMARTSLLSAGLETYDPTIEDSYTPVMEHRGFGVISGGTVNATFRVPGSATMPSDGFEHNVTISQLQLNAEMSWVALPKVDNKTRLKAKITNDSEYTLLEGKASIYVDGSFIASTHLPWVNPQESFVCPLGMDPSVKVTYHPEHKKSSKSGLVSKTSTYTVSQRITVHNTKASAIQRVKIIDHIPVSEQENVNVRLISPSLTLPAPPSTESEKDKALIPPPVPVSDGVVAHWEGADEPGTNVETLGQDGKLYWSCSVPALGKVNLLLQWELQAPSRFNIAGF